MTASPALCIEPQTEARPQAAEAARAARTRMLLEGPIAPTLAKLAAPNIVAMLVMAAVSIAEGVFAAQLGVSSLAGLALVFPLVMLTQMLSGGSMGGAISSAVARALGGGNAARAGGLAMAAWVVAVIAAIASALLMTAFGAGVFAALGGGGEAVAAALNYAGVFFPGCLTVWVLHTTLSVIRGTGNMGAPSMLMLLTSLAAIPLSGAMALGWGPFPALGMAGLAAGTIVAHGFGAALALLHVLSGRTGLPLREGRLGSGLFGDILGVGAIASVNSVLTVLTVSLMVGAVGRYGEAALAGYGLGARLEFLMIPIVFGIGATMTAMVGANIGAGQKERALKIAWTGSFAAAAIVGTIGIGIAIAPDLWLGLFLAPSEAEALAAGRAYFRIVAPFYGFFGLGLALYFASQGAERMAWPFTGGVVRIVVAFGGAMALSATTDLGVQGVFAAIGAAMLLYGVFVGGSILLTKWK